MKTRKFLSILLTALLVAQCMGCVVFADNSVSASANIIKSSNAVVIANETGRLNSATPAALAIDGDYTTYIKTQNNTYGSDRTFRFSLDLNTKQRFNKVVVYEQIDTGRTSVFAPGNDGNVTIMVSNEYTDDDKAYNFSNAGTFSEFGDNKVLLTTGDFYHGFEEVTNGYKHTFTFDASKNARYVSFQVVYPNGTRPYIYEIELYHEQENLVQAAADDYLTAIGEDSITADNVFGKGSVDGLLVKTDTGYASDMTTVINAINGINNSSTDVFTTATGPSKLRQRVSVNLQKQRTFNKVVFYEYVGDAGTSKYSAKRIFVANTHDATQSTTTINSTSGIYNGANSGYDSVARFTDKSEPDNSITTETVATGVLKHTVEFNEPVTAKYVILDTSCLKVNNKADAPSLMEIEVYYVDPALSAVNAAADADAMISAVEELREVLAENTSFWSAYDSLAAEGKEMLAAQLVEERPATETGYSAAYFTAKAEKIIAGYSICRVMGHTVDESGVLTGIEVKNLKLHEGTASVIVATYTDGTVMDDVSVKSIGEAFDMNIGSKKVRVFVLDSVTLQPLGYTYSIN